MSNDATFSASRKRLATGSWDNTARISDAAGGQKMLTLRGHAGFVESVAFSPDGKRLATGGDDTIIWDATSGQEMLS
jgi:WD40 repeat protein